MTESRIRLAELVTAFFTRHLAAELNASPHTIVSYRDTFRFLLRHLAESTHRQVSQLTYEDFTPEAILTFLDNLERQRHNSTATRNARLAAIRSFFSYVVNRDPAAAAPAQRVLSIPFKKAPRRDRRSPQRARVASHPWCSRSVDSKRSTRLPPLGSAL